MQSERIYSAPSLRDVARQLLIYRLTGVLTLWRAASSRQEDVKITVEQGRLIHIFWGVAYQEIISDTTLEWLNNWGEIHFSFLATDMRLRLPPPSYSSQMPQNAQIQEPRQTYATGPVSTASHPSVRVPNTPNKPEAVVAVLTSAGKSYPPASLARYERTIFLLINGKRSMVDLSQLTKRTPDEIYTTLNRLEQMQLITIHTVTR